MSQPTRRALLSSHISSAFTQPIFYQVPPTTSSKHQHQQPLTHASQKLVERLNTKKGISASQGRNQTNGQTGPLAQSFEEHAIHASTTSLPVLGDALMRITHSGYVLELTLLDWADGTPVCWEFAERIVPMPGIAVTSPSQDVQIVARTRGAVAPSGQLACVYVLLEGGTLYRLAFPLTPPLFHDENWVAKRGWCREFTLPSTVSRPIGGTSGSMILQGDRSIVVTVNSGAVLRMDIDVDNDGQMREKLHYPQHHSLLSKMFRTAQEEDTIVSVIPASVAGSDLLFTLSRDRCLRAWDRQVGNTLSLSVPSLNNANPDPIRGSSLIRGSSATPQVGGASTLQLLPPERRSLLRSFFTEDEETLSNLRILVFIPTIPGLTVGASGYQSSSAGVFALYKIEGNQFKPLGEKEASIETTRCSLRDFMIMPNSRARMPKELHCLWEHSGESMYEYTELNIETRPSGGVRDERRNLSASGDIEMREVGSNPLPDESICEEDEDELYAADWHIIPPLAMPSITASSLSPEPTADSVDFLSTINFTSPNAASTILDALFRAGSGGFSPYTISEALNGYVEAAWVSTDQVDPIKDPNSRLRAALSKQYSTLRARVSAIVGCRLQDPGIFSDPSSANPFNASVMVDAENGITIPQHTEYHVAFRRDWEGFLARCREIEKAGSWPVALGVVGSKRTNSPRSPQNITNAHCVILERERMGLMVTEDQPLDLYRQTLSKMQEDDNTAGFQAFGSVDEPNAPMYLVYTALSFRALFAPSSWADVAHELYKTMHQTVSLTYHDLLVDLAIKLDIMDLDIDTIRWVFECVDALGGPQAFHAALQSISALVRTTGIAKELDSVKQEDDEDEVDRMLLHPDPNQSLLAENSHGVIRSTGSHPADYHNQWSRSLTAVYLSATLQARYEIASSIIFLLIFVVARGEETDYVSGLPNPVVVDELFAGLRSVSMLRQTATRVVEGATRSATGLSSAFGPSRTIARHVRAGTADSMVRQLAGMRVAPVSSAQFPQHSKPHVHFASPTGSSFPTLPPTTRGSGTVTLLQSLLPPLRRPFSLPYAADGFLEANGIVQADSMLVAGYDEVRFAEELRKKGHTSGAADIIDWLPKSNACSYVFARLQLQSGEYEEAAPMFEHSARSFGPLSYKTGIEESTLVAVLPPSLSDLSSLTAYYEHVAKLFEAEAQYSIAVLFYRLAIEAANDHEPTTDLWYNIFKGELALENFERAYTTLAEMSEQPSLRTNSVAELVTTMCERNKVETLLSFNFVGFADDVEQALGFKARNADPLDRPVYAKIYYAWAVKKGDYRAAASTMYQRARILGQQGKPDTDTRFILMSLQLEAYTVAINALCLLDPEDAWISLPVYEGPGEVPPEWRRSNFGMVDVGEQAGNDSEIVELDDMRREMELCRARRHLVYMMAGLNEVQRAAEVDDRDFTISPMEVLRRYCQLARYEEALYSARVFRADMTVIVTMMVDMCMRLSKGGEAALTSFESRWLLQDKAMIWEGEPISKAWRLLQDSLERHDTSDSGWQYRKTCLERILEADRLSAPPTWLATFFQDREPEYLIRACMRYHLILPALDYTLLMIQKVGCCVSDANILLQANQPFNKGATVAVTQTRLPYPLIDAVVAAAQTDDEVRKAAVIKAEIEARIGKVGRWEWS